LLIQVVKFLACGVHPDFTVIAFTDARNFTAIAFTDADANMYATSMAQRNG